MRIANITLDSPAEVEGHFADVIYMQGCNRSCCYCFNKELIDPEGGMEVNEDYIINKLKESVLSNVVVITGGEPALQDLGKVLDFIKFDLKKKLVIETSYLNFKQWVKADLVLYCIKTFDMGDLNLIDMLDFVKPVIVVNHECFNWDNFEIAMRKLSKNPYIRFYNDDIKYIQRLYKIIKENGKKFKVFKKICL